MNPAIVEDVIEARRLPPPPWRYTDDAEMALSIFSVLRQRNEIDQDHLARSFSEPNASVRLAVSTLGNGEGISAQDPVPYVLWCAGQHLDSYEEALWLTVSGLGDRDTTCAMVGGIVSMYTGLEGIPVSWRAAREPLPRWPFLE